MPERPRSIVGRHSYGPGATVSYAPGVDDSQLRVGAFCSFASGVKILLGGEHHPEWVTTFPFHDEAVWGSEKPVAWGRGDVEVGNDVWVGTDALILSGSVIGDGAVIGARTVVSGEVAPYAVVAGNPVRFVRWRFSADVRAELGRIAWWSWADDRIKRAVPYLLDPDVERFVRLVNRGEL